LILVTGEGSLFLVFSIGFFTCLISAILGESLVTSMDLFLSFNESIIYMKL